MIFSYGFIEDGMTDARDVFLDLDVAEDDPLRLPKKHMAATAPGVRLYSHASGISWESSYIWLMCVNEEDGLDFAVAQRVDGQREVQAWWQGQQLEDLSGLKSLLQATLLWEVYLLRAVVTLQGRVAKQLETLERAQRQTPDGSVASESIDGAVRDQPKKLARELRRLETGLLEEAYAYFEQQVSSSAQIWMSLADHHHQKMSLAQSETVAQYLRSATASRDEVQDDVEDDFS